MTAKEMRLSLKSFGEVDKGMISPLFRLTRFTVMLLESMSVELKYKFM